MIVYAPQPDNQVKQSELLQPTQLSKAQQQQQYKGHLYQLPYMIPQLQLIILKLLSRALPYATKGVHCKTFSTIISHSESPTTTTTTKQNEEKSIADTKSFTHKASPAPMVL